MRELHIPHRRLAESVRRLILREIDDMCYPPRPDHAVHDLRVSAKRIRAWLGALRDALPAGVYAREKRMIRDLGRLFSGRRDSRVLVETFDTLAKAGLAPFVSDAATAVRRRLKAEADAAEQATPLPEALAQVRDVLFPARRRFEAMDLAKAHPKAAFRRIWKTARRAYAHALKTRDTEALHEWRKAAKSLRFQLDALHDIWPRRIARLSQGLKTQGDLLGQDHDLAVLYERLEDEAQRQAVTERRAALQAEVLQGAKRFYRPKPKKLARRLDARWKRWRRA
jgi:CHAD domain-containing protein